MVSIYGKLAVAATGTVLAITVASAQSAQAADFQTFNDFNSWKNSVAEFRLVEEFFESDIDSAISIEFDSGIISTNSVPGFNGFPGLGEVDNRVIATWNQFTNCVELGGVICSQEWTWEFPNPVTGFGFHIFSADIGRLAIRGDFGNGEQVIPVGETIDPGTTDFAVGFLGITAAQPFDTVTFFSRAGNDFVNIDPIGTSNPPVVFALAESVPEPALTLSLLALGAWGTGSTFRRNKK